MNPNLSILQAYPFERLRQLFSTVTPNPAYRPISLGIGEPRHATPELIKTAYCNAIQGIGDSSGGLASYPATAGTPALRQSMQRWLHKRYGLELDEKTQILPVNGSREALFALAQTVVHPAKPSTKTPTEAPMVVCPNPWKKTTSSSHCKGQRWG